MQTEYGRCLPAVHCCLLQRGIQPRTTLTAAPHPPRPTLALPAQLFFMPTKRTGSLDIEGSKGYVY